MSNPTSVVTERRLGEFYQEILPYLGGSADAGFTPVGSVIAIMGVTAPANYLACDGTVYNISDYPELANYFYQQFGSKNKFGGDGTTTFAVPDLKGEFLRGTGTNSHTGNGNGADVGVHQDSTRVPHIWQDLDANSAMFFNYIASEGAGWQSKNEDAKISTDRQARFSPATKDATTSGAGFITIRPTNTSILWCIATKDIYLNPAMDYSTSEKVVGKWIDGKTLYQKTIVKDLPKITGTERKFITLVSSSELPSNIETIPFIRGTLGGKALPLINYVSAGAIGVSFCGDLMYASTNNEIQALHYGTTWLNDGTGSLPLILTIQYTKTT